MGCLLTLTGITVFSHLCPSSSVNLGRSAQGHNYSADVACTGCEQALNFYSNQKLHMTNFVLTPDMLTMSDTFYPKGYAFIMFPDAASAAKVAQSIGDHPGAGSHVSFLSAAVVLKEIGKVDGDSDIELPSVGTEGATVHKYVDLARKGHCALLVKVDSDEETERVMQVARKAGFSYGQRYHLLAIEDLE